MHRVKVLAARTLVSLIVFFLSLSWGAVVLMAADKARAHLDETSIGEMASTIFFLGVLVLFATASKATKGLKI